jgi:hypothetical protein
LMTATSAAREALIRYARERIRAQETIRNDLFPFVIIFSMLYRSLGKGKRGKSLPFPIQGLTTERVFSIVIWC